MTYACLSTQHDSSKDVKIASIWNISYQFIYQLTDLNCAFLTDQAITQNYMCLLLYADNQYAVAKIGNKKRGGVYTIFSQTIEKQKKKINFKISKNELQISTNELQMSSNRAIYTYKIFNWKSPKKVKIATLWRDHLMILRRGGLANIVGTGGGVRPGWGGVKNKGGRREFSTWFLIFLCKLPVCVYSVYVNGVAACSKDL